MRDDTGGRLAVDGLQGELQRRCPLRIALLGLVTTALALIAASCGGGAGGSAVTARKASARRDTLILSNIVAASTQLASAAGWANQSPYMQAVYDTLLHEAPDGSIEPWLASEWAYSDDRRTLTLTLRSDVVFSDGTRFTADAAAQNLLRFRDGSSPKRARLANVADVKATGDHTVQITLSRPDPGLLPSLAQNPGLQESPAQFDAPDAEAVPVGSGPYILDSMATVPGSRYVYHANPGYWAPETRHYSKLIINVYDQEPTIVNAISTGEINGAQLPGSGSIRQIEAAGFTLYPQEISFNGLLILDRDGVINKALGDVRVRQAINHAIDRKAMLEAAANGLGTMTTQVLAPSSPAYDATLDGRYPYDPVKARQLLAAAGYPHGFKLTMPAIAGTGNLPLATLTAAFLGDAGIKVVYDQQADLASYVGALTQGKFGVGWMQLQTSPSAAFVVADRIAKGGPFNPFDTDRPQVTAWLDRIHAGTVEESNEAAKALNAYIVEQAWFDPWYRNKTFFAADANTVVTQQDTNTYPYLWNIKPKR
ncbi:MAG: peptide ABC transporter substrate-binding protein [Gammaproteobacteria bacterium]|nr:peptide ABC transporter substrate-binding protein [Gammaproteobacteria bacterium]